MIDSSSTNTVTLIFTHLEIVTIAAGLIGLLRSEHPALTDDKSERKIKSEISALLKQIPPLWNEEVIHDGQDDTHEVKCPVTGQVLCEAGDRRDGIDFDASDAFVGDWQDVELECASFKDGTIEAAWSDFIDSTPPHDGYDDLIQQFVVYNFHLFQSMDLLLVTSDCDATRTTSYILLNKAYKK